MTYAIKFVNFTLAAPFQKKSRPLTGGCARFTRFMVATHMTNMFVLMQNIMVCPIT